MSISNHSVDVRASTEALEAQLASYEASYERMYADDSADEAQLEWLESGIELIEAELDRREDPYPTHDDTPSLQDMGIEIGSYLS